MKNTIKFFLVAAALVIGGSAFAVGLSSSGIPTKEVTIGLNDVYVPGGFDSSMDAYVIVNGIFPNGCYKWKGAEVTDLNTYKHQVVSKATVSQGMCLMVLVPFTRDVKLGKLQSGVHQLRFMNGDGTYFEKVLNIE